MEKLEGLELLLQVSDLPAKNVILSPQRGDLIALSDTGQVLRGKEFEVVGRVIRPVAVLVMHRLGWEERTAKNPLHDESMFLDLPAGLGIACHDVPLSVNATILVR